MGTVCRLILEFFNRYHTQPSYDTFISWATDWCTRYHVPDQTKMNLLNLTYQIFTIDMSDGDAVRDTAVEFAKRQALKIAILQVTDLLDKHDDYEKAQHLVNRALMTGQGIGSHGTEVFSTIPMLPTLLSADSPYAIHRRIPTPFPSLNQARMGGLGPGECMVIVGSSGQGKSIIKNNCMAVATQNGGPNAWGAHATLELKEVDNHLRYAARVLNLDQSEIVHNTEDFRRKSLGLAQQNRIYVKWFAPGITTVQTLRSWISALSAELGCGPCALLVDYPDLMIPSKGAAGSLYVDHGTIYSELINLLADYSMPGFFSSQIDRSHQYSNDSRAGNIANSIAKLYHADVVGTINQSEEDKQRGIGRIWWDKCRRGRDMFYTYYRINYSKCLVYEDQEVATEVQTTATRGRGQNANANTLRQ